MAKISRLLLLSLLGWPPTVWAADALTSITAIRALTPEQAEQRQGVVLDAVTTFYHQDWGVLFIHDGKDGICVGVPKNLRPAVPYAKGTQLHVEGVTGPGEFLPVVLPTLIQKQGSGVLPAYQRVSAEELFLPALDCHPVEVSAVVKGTSFMDESLVVDLLVDGWLVKALLPQHEALTQLPWQLIERRVTVRGVAGTHFNDQRQMSGRLLFVPGLESFTLAEDLKTNLEVPLVTVDGLLRAGSPLRQRVRVQGVATHVVEGRGVYLRGVGGSMYVQTAQPLSVKRGDEVEAVGYPVVTPFRPSLSAVDVKPVGENKAVAPVTFHAADTRNSREQCELVTLEAEFIEMTHTRDVTTLLCRTEGEIFEALLTAPDLPAEEYSPGMKLRLTGICELVTTRPLVIPRNATSFRIQLREAADVLVLARQPWWNAEHALWVLGGLGALAAVIAGWAVTLQFMVRSQSSVIRQQAQQQATLEERQRIARDLHDTLEQELVGVNMLLDSTAMKLNGENPAAAEPLGLARRLLRRAREDSRTTIRELRSVALEQRGLPAALEELLRPMATVGDAEFNVQTTGTPRRLVGTLETNLLRIAQEAVANAARHAQAKHIDLKLHYGSEQVTLDVRDDGKGFDQATATAEAGHFGLSGMKERCDKIGGQFHLTCKLGEGTHVSVTAPAVAVINVLSNPPS